MSLEARIKAHPAVAHLWWVGGRRHGRWEVELRPGWEYVGPAFYAGIYANPPAMNHYHGDTLVEARRLRDIWTAVQAAGCTEVTE